MTSGGKFVPTPAGAIQADDNTLAGRTPKPKLVPTDDDDDDPANPKVDRRAEAKQKAKQSGVAKARTDSFRERTNPGNAETNDNPRNHATTKTDGVGFEPTNDFRRCRFSRSAKPLRALPKRTPRKTGAKRPRGHQQRATDTLAQLPEPSQFETPQAKSRPLAQQVSDKSRLACFEMAEERDSPALPCSIRKGLGTGTAGK